MIYFLDNSLQLQKIVTSKNVISAIHEHELNGLIRADVELDLSYANKFLILGIDHVGYYYKDEFYLHKIQRVEYDHVNESAKIVLRHIFFEDMIFGKLIRDVRPQNQDALAVSQQTIDANTRWQTIMTDVTGRLSTNFYWQVPYEVIEFMTENYRIEYLPKILFDGQKINGFQLHLANKVGEDKNIRIPYGSRVLDLKYEEDYSEIITKLVVHGKGEEVGDGYGRRINISDVNFSRNGVESPVGSLYLEDESITNTYGNDRQTPREGREVFEDIEDANELAEAGYQHYLQVSRPQMLFTADVADIGDVGIGDSVMIIRREYDVYFNARIHKLSVDLLYPEDAQVELGDYKHFKESKIARKSREKSNRVQGQLSDRITRLKQEANDFIDGEFAQAISEFEQNLIDQKALIEADRENMTNLINTKIDEFDASFAAGMAEAERKRQENYDAMSDYVNTTVDTTRAAIEQEIADSIAEAEYKAQQEYDAIKVRITDTVDTTREDLELSIGASIETAKQYADQQAQAKSEAVRTDLETVTSGHQAMIDSLQDNVMNIDDFIGDKTLGLNELLYNERQLFEEKLNDVDTWHYNMLRGTRFDENYWNATFGSIRTDEEIPYYYFDPNATTSNLPYVQSTQEIVLEQGEVYRLSFDWQTYAVRAVDYVYIIASPDDPVRSNVNIGIPTEQGSRIDGTNLFTSWGSEYGRYYIEFTPFRDIRGFIRIGANLTNNEHGRRPFKIRLPYLTTTENTRWLYHQLDTTQNVEEITRRIMELEDGREEFITKAQYNFDTGEVDGRIRHIRDTVDGYSSIITNHENWITQNGSSILQTVDEMTSKIWLNDIHKPNMIPYSRFVVEENIDMWTGRQAPLLNKYEDEWLQIRNTNSVGYLGVDSPIIPGKITSGETYTISWEAFFNISSTRIDYDFSYMFIRYSNSNNQNIGKPRLVRIRPTTIAGVVRDVYIYELTFTANNSDNNASIIFGTKSETGTDIRFFMRYPKLEVGSVSTPYFNAFSNFSQRADEISLAVQGIDTSGYLSQSDIQIVPDYVKIGSQRLDGSAIGSMLRVSPTGIDMVAEAMRLSGDLYVDGDITSLAVNAVRGDITYLKANILTADSINAKHIESETIGADQIRANSVLINKLFTNSFAAGHISTTALEAVEGEFASLFAAQVKANTISVDYISGRTAWFERLYTLNANIERLVSQTVFTNAINAKVGNFIDLNAGNIVTAGLSANVIKSDHIQVGTALVNKMFSSSARIDELITKTHFVNEMHALTMNVVTLNASEIRSRILTANTIDAKWLKTGTALIDRIFSSTAMFERMMSKSAFITTLNTVSIDTDQLTIRRADGGVLMSNGTQKFGSPIITKPFPESTGVSFDGINYVTTLRSAQSFERAYGEHSGRYANFSFRLGLRWDSDHASSYVRVVIRPGTTPSGVTIPTVNEQFIAYRDRSESHTISVRMPVPTFGAVSWTLEFYRVGDNNSNYVQIRSERCWVSA